MIVHVCMNGAVMSLQRVDEGGLMRFLIVEVHVKAPVRQVPRKDFSVVL